MTGGDVGPLGKSGAAEINKLFRWADKSKKGLILFVDEADAFLRAGRGGEGSAASALGTQGGGAMSEDTRNAISAFLHHTGTETDKFCVVLATNCRDVLDRVRGCAGCRMQSLRLGVPPVLPFQKGSRLAWRRQSLTA